MKQNNPRGLSASAPGLNTCILQLFSNIFSETPWSIKAKLPVKPSLEVGKKLYIKGTGHMSKMAALLIYGKNLRKSSPTYLIVLRS